MVTAELAFAGLFAAAMVVLGWWCVGLLVMQIRCIDAVAEIARQAARGDLAAVTAAKARLPADSEVALEERGGSVVARVATRVPVPLGLPGPLEVTATSVALSEAPS